MRSAAAEKTSRMETPAALAMVGLALLVRVCVSMGPYSGMGNPPKYGDYEAQRHWMELSAHLPPRDWYRNGTNNDLSYWGLDYPPLSAYQSLAHARLFLLPFSPDSLALRSSRGYESPFSYCTHSLSLPSLYLLLSSDLLIFFPAALSFVYMYQAAIGRRQRSGDGKADDSVVTWHLAMILFNPALILIDHGHFQYNCISLGFTLGAIAAILSKKDLLASLLFSLALNHKQMSAYFAPAFFAHLLGKSLKRQSPVFEVFKLGLVVLLTFTIVWSPYLYSMKAVMEVLSRLAPFERGIYEDYVANFWCTSSILVKWKILFSLHSLKLLSSGATILITLPSMVQQIKDPSDLGFLYALFNSSFSFYLFSFQVHEKSILLPLLPATLLALREPQLLGLIMHFALLSMYPLLCRDRLIFQYAALLALFVLIFFRINGSHIKKKESSPAILKFLMTMAMCCSFTLHYIYMILQPPEKYPFLFEALIMALCFSQFAMLTVYTNMKQWMLLGISSEILMEKKNI
ncbi:putative dolichyl pyrophosphate Man9GlcNAc2 alpha-1,3-glucosyltransferase [Acorus gramineus]|uniref:Alpha-1,3-glucosyltransferase n=1 Tax=Acorus gramineus TaxID=55184 RepID=A0AAV9ALU5_ACOGR|nr:putative dolichyl pyrophosphate Man9GlcNAc2 alpha-1,3-glucosyltransferase [Acorus gramineus]